MVELKHLDGHGTLLMSVPQMPRGRNSTKQMKIAPITSGHDSVNAASAVLQHQERERADERAEERARAARAAS